MAMLSENGALAYMQSMPRQELLIKDARDALFAEIDCPGSCNQLRWSPDGKHIAMYIGDTADPQIGVYDVETNAIRRLHGVVGAWPSWTGDSKRIVFTGKSGEPSTSGQAMWVPADGSSLPEPIPGTEVFGGSVMQALVSPDMKHVIIRTENSPTDAVATLHAFEVPLGGGRKPRPVITEVPNPYYLAISPDGKWLAYNSNRGGRTRAQLFVQPLLGGGRVQVSAGEGSLARWTADGRKLVYGTGTGYRIASLDFEGTLPRVSRTDSLGVSYSFALHPREMLFATVVESGRPPQLKLVPEFSAMVRDKVSRR